MLWRYCRSGWWSTDRYRCLRRRGDKRYYYQIAVDEILLIGCTHQFVSALTNGVSVCQTDNGFQEHRAHEKRIICEVSRIVINVAMGPMSWNWPVVAA
ncbi:hypothetical protein BN2476_120041 [Paraburkholderia piptadeniae]|uniref:Uncharacterized protein n=1 Tax=Paraburkholderia piptadeniae TaxID=1701573 RepID=A0A1N7RR39_9BURK|nr:hypothetical protein BN2476_120041 [Paraburkholderia piptadeniae]